MWWALFWGAVAGGAVLLGAVLGVYVKGSPRLIGGVMAFGSGVLISALAFSLTAEAFDKGGYLAVTIGLALGAMAFFLGSVILERHGAHDRKRSGGQRGVGQKGASNNKGMMLALGALLDGIPESAAIGISLLGGGSVGVPVVAAVFLSNIPEGWSSSAGMRKNGRSVRYILLLWLAVTVASAISALLGFVLLAQAPDVVVGAVEAFAAGAVITMLADTMMPEAFERGGATSGLLTALGFILSFFLSQF
ncbi:ZIP family metal transporter [Aestuariimicrobium sp. T2.26MG-19.2B]|uniref:ZIP family metal transporter n=1 Tax=Aestuariimicrobium sp. T2.26MG-19.2B TaxID=3040679 RepID=UPI0024777EFC|nr:ZIP family metal transporter [Aestuariimicrobium sp. T2.26MG-19.2B]CAI9405966.1 Zinc transporter ZupT [Aestuariimicrobium sp. T2.26MG-19.2B]